MAMVSENQYDAPVNSEREQESDDQPGLAADEGAEADEEGGDEREEKRGLDRVTAHDTMMA